MIHVHNKTVASLIAKEIREGRGADEIMHRFRNSVIVQALTMNGWNISHAAQALKTHRNNLINWMREAGISADDVRLELKGSAEVGEGE